MASVGVADPRLGVNTHTAGAVARRRAFFAMPPKLLIDLPAEVVQHILGRIQLAHHIARAAPTCKVVSVAARNVIKVRKFSGEVVTLVGHNVMSVAAAPDGRIVTGSSYKTLKVWRNGACERTIQAHIHEVTALAVLPGGARFVAAAAAAAGTWSSQDPEGYVI